MDYDYRNRLPPSSSMYGAAGGSAAPPMYPRISAGPTPPPPGRPAPHLQPAAASSPHHSSSPSGLIKVVIKPEYQITPPPQLSPEMAEIPRTTFQFDFEYERRILAEAEKESQNWAKFSAENQSTKSSASTSSSVNEHITSKFNLLGVTEKGPTGDPIVDKYVSSGLGREAVTLAVLNYGDNPTHVREFVKGFKILREMGFPSKDVAEALAMYDNDTDKACSHLINSS